MILDTLACLGNTWSWKMAWRDSRGQRGRFLLSLSCIVLGVAALVALRSFSENISSVIHAQSRELLGADLVLRSRQPFPSEVDKFVDGIPGEGSSEVRFSTMAFFPKGENSRLAQIRAIEGNFPFYGTLGAEPPSSIADFRIGPPRALVEESLLLQFNAKIGDLVRIGEQEFSICGRLQKIPGETILFSQLAPRILISMDYLKNTQLIQFGSRVFYRKNLKYIIGFDDQHLFARLNSFHERFGIRYETVNSRKESLGKRFSNLFNYLNLVGLAALILGGIGIGNSLYLYINSKIKSVAILRCLGASTSITLGIYFNQTVLLGFLGGVIGAGVGVAIQYSLPLVMGSFIPFSVNINISWNSVVFGIFIGSLSTLIFSLIPLLSIRGISPLVLIQSADPLCTKEKNSIRFLGYLIIGLGVLFISTLSTDETKKGLMIGVALLAVFLTLSLLSKIFIWILQKFRWSKLPFIFRQGIRNLFRPKNQTWLLILTVGVGTFLVVVLYLSELVLLRQFDRSSSRDSPNMVLFDIQVDQVDIVERLLNESHNPILQRVPIVTMKLASVNGLQVEEIRRENQLRLEEERIPNWALNREYRSTYRDHLVNSETLIEGEFEKGKPYMQGLVPISMEKGIAEKLEVELGDYLEFNVQGMPIKTVIASIRQVDWHRIQPNFFVVFPTGFLEDAPQMMVIVTHISSKEESASLQQRVVKVLPNVSVVDLTLVIETVTRLLDKVKLALEFMAFFSVLCGVIVLVSSISNATQQRMRENALLKVLGASKRQLATIMGIEFLTLGLLSVNSGNLLAIAGSWALAHFVFDVKFILDWQVLILANGFVVGTIVAIGIIQNSLSYHKTASLVLCAEAE